MTEQQNLSKRKYWENAALKEKTERKISMETRHYIVEKISGEYATLRDVENGGEMFIALALLPEETDIGVKLLWEELTYTVEE